MTMHAIFFSSTDAQCRAPFLRKIVIQSDDGNDDNAKVRAALSGTKERQVKVAAIIRTSWVCAGSSCVVGTLRKRVSLGLWECVVTTVPGKCECSY